MTGLCPIHNLIILIIPKQGIEMQFFLQTGCSDSQYSVKMGTSLSLSCYIQLPPPPPPPPGQRSRKSKMVKTATISIFVCLELVEKFRLKIPKFLFFCVVFSNS